MSLETFLPACDTICILTLVTGRVAHVHTGGRVSIRAHVDGTSGGVNGGQGGECDGECGKLHVQYRKILIDICNDSGCKVMRQIGEARWLY